MTMSRLKDKLRDLRDRAAHALAGAMVRQLAGMYGIKLPKAGSGTGVFLRTRLYQVTFYAIDPKVLMKSGVIGFQLGDKAVWPWDPNSKPTTN